MNLYHSAKFRINKITKRFQNSVVILCYHRVGKNTNDLWGNSVSVENFHDQMDYLSQNYKILSIDDLYNYFKNGRIRNKKNILITFDDGYEINTKYAIETLRYFKIPSTFYINTYTLGTSDFFWWDYLQLIFSNRNLLTDELKINIFKENLIFPLNNDQNISFAIQTIHRFLKGQKSIVRKNLLDLISNQISNPVVGDEEILPITEEGILQTSKDELFTVGGHTHSHNSISLLNQKSQTYEIKTNKNILEELIKKNVKHFSYPFGGKSDYDINTIKIIQKLGYKSAVNTCKSPFRLNDNIFEIPRFSIKNWDKTSFTKKINSYFNF